MKKAVNIAKISSAAGEINNAQCQMHGRKGVCCLSDARNMAKENEERVFAKPSKIVVESFFRRSSLNDDAMTGIMNMVKDGIFVEQSAYCRTEADVGALFFIGDRFRIVHAGDIVVLHFVDGMLLNAEELSPQTDRPSIGSVDYDTPETTEVMEFGHGENTFLFCTRSFADAMTEDLLEDTLQRSIYTIDEKHNVTAYDCNRWLKVLREIYEEDYSGKPFTAMAISIPTKKQRPGKKKAVIWGVVALVLVVVAVFLLGALRRGGPGNRPGGPGQMPPGYSDQMPSNPSGGPGQMPSNPSGGPGQMPPNGTQTPTDSSGGNV